MDDNRDFELIDEEKISKMLFGEEKYMIEFAEASIESFSDFSEAYSEYLLNRDLENLRNAGHKIKPVAQMLDLEQVIEIYEEAKELLANNSSQNDLSRSVEEQQSLCNRIISDFETLILRYKND